MGCNIFLQLLITSILLTISCSAQEEGNATGSSADIEQLWNEFKLKYGKIYGSESEEEMRKEIFKENLNKTNSLNDLYANGKSSFSAGTNQFSDMTYSEFLATTNCLNTVPFSIPNGTIYKDNSTKFPRNIDWREKGYVTPVKDQGRCRACWAFVTTGALEGLNARKTGRLVPLSEQQLIDCSRKYLNEGCNIGAPGRSFNYISDNGGINSEASYHYEGTDGPCRYQPNATAATCDVLAYVRGETNIQAVVARVGPAAVGLYVSESLRMYKGGIYDDDNCIGNVGHAMLIVGYGTDPSTGKDYWIVKNSWGTTWGMDGYVLIVRNKGMCLIDQFAVYPVLLSNKFRGSSQQDDDD